MVNGCVVGGVWIRGKRCCQGGRVRLRGSGYGACW